MMKQKTLSILLAMFMSMVACVASAHDFEVDGIYYKITSSTDHTVSVTCHGDYYYSYSYEYTGSVVIPQTVTYSGKTYSVTSIGDEAFRGCSGLTSVTIPYSVTAIGSTAFYDCSGLTSVTIPNSVTEIGSSAFSGCSGLTSVTIGNSVTSIGSAAFYYCSGLTSIIVEDGNSKYDSRDGCNAIIESSSNTLVAGCKNTAIPNSVTSIGSYAFSGCSGMTSVTIPNSVTSIGYVAFFGCSGLTSVTIPNSVTSIGSYAFEGCSGLTSVTIPNSVTTIGDRAFAYCSKLTSINIPENATTIGNGAFYGCQSLLTVTIKCTLVGTWFKGISSIRNLILGEGIRRINDEAFSGCTNILDVFCYANTVPITGSNAFKSVTGGAILHVPSSAMGSYRSQSPWSEFYNIVALTDKETGIMAIDNGQQKAYKVYDMNGRKYTQMQRGVNIIRSADGTTRKVLVK